MGRSVETIRDAEAIAYLVYDHDPQNPDSWADFVDSIKDAVQKYYPSFGSAWCEWFSHPYRETRIILDNACCQITISEYCGLVAVCVVPMLLDDDYPEVRPHNARNLNWTRRVAPYIVKHLNKEFGGYNKIGTASNGEAFFERAAT